jgi:hypothetical protein
VKARNGDRIETVAVYSDTRHTLAKAPGPLPFSNVTPACLRANWAHNGNPGGTEYFCENVTTGTNSGWTTNMFWDNCGLVSGKSYAFRVKARNKEGIETDWTSLGSQSTVGIFITSPATGENWEAGTTQTIRWTYGGSPSPFVKIDLLKGGVMNHSVAKLVSIKTGSYNWKIPLDQAPGTGYQIKVTSTNNGYFTDTSENNFAIVGPTPPAVSVVSPNSGEAWQAGTTQTIRWTYAGSPGNYLKIELLKAGVLNRTITNFVSTGRGSYTWRIPATQTPGNDYRIRITSRTNPSCTGTSDSDFTIGGPVP